MSDQVKPQSKAVSPETAMLSYGYDHHQFQGSVKCPIYQTSTFAFKNAREGKDFFSLAYGLRPASEGEELGYIYSRIDNPNLHLFEERLALWEKAPAAAVFASGMAVIACTFFEFLRPGDTLLYSQPVYGGTDHFIKHVLPRFGIKTLSFSAKMKHGEVRDVIKNQEVQDTLAMIYVETPANPTNQLFDLTMCAELADEFSTQAKKVLFVADNTFLGPLFQHPLDFGADLSLYSATKFLGGHSDIVAGAAVGQTAIINRLKAMRTFCGSMASPFDSWLLTRSLETLSIRMHAQSDNAQTVAAFLSRHPAVDQVFYLGLLPDNSTQAELCRKQCLAPGSMISFNVSGGEEAAFKVLDKLRIFKLAVSLGGTESLAQHPYSMTHADVPPADKQAIGLTDSMIRLSIGIENPQDLIADLDQALAP